VGEALRPAPTTTKIHPLILILGGVVLVVIVLAALGGRGGRAPASVGPDRIAAWVDCKEFVSRGLKAPASAVFPLSNAPGVTIGQAGGRWVVAGFVDAQNSFGAQLRQDFQCEMTYAGNTATIRKLVIGSNTLLDT
jgi:hypothetical protein